MSDRLILLNSFGCELVRDLSARHSTRTLPHLGWLRIPEIPAGMNASVCHTDFALPGDSASLTGLKRMSFESSTQQLLVGSRMPLQPVLEAGNQFTRLNISQHVTGAAQ
jgi:hypothetical protein